jgi:hypothetical protein
LKIRTQRRPPAIVARLLEPWFEFGGGEARPWFIAVGRDKRGNVIYAPTSNPEAFDMSKKEAPK